MSASVVSSLCVVMPVWTSPRLRTHRTLHQGAVPEPAAESEYPRARPPCVRGIGTGVWAGRVTRFVNLGSLWGPTYSDRLTGPRTPSEPMNSWPLHRPNNKINSKEARNADEKAHRLVIHHARRSDAGSRGARGRHIRRFQVRRLVRRLLRRHGRECHGRADGASLRPASGPANL